MEILLCCIGRLENNYIRDFIQYYKNLGFSHIVIIDNNMSDEEYFEWVIRDYINDGYVDIEDYRNQIKPQYKAYRYVYEKYYRDYDWIAFFDIDEYLTFPEGSNLESFLAEECFQEANQISINWIVYGDNDMLYPSSEPLYERFAKVADGYGNLYDAPMNSWVKSIVRGRDNHMGELLCDGEGVHYFNIKGKTFHASGKEIIWPDNCISPDFSKAWIRHFMTKSTSEYLLRLKRGGPDKKRNVREKMIPYWSINKITDKKRKIIYGKNTNNG